MTDALGEIGGWVRHAALAALQAPLQPDNRLYAPYLGGALVLAIVVWCRRRGRRSLLAFLFPRHIWLHRSALFDYRMVAVRGLLELVVLGSLSVSAAAIGLQIARVLWAHVGILPRFSLPAWAIMVLFSVAAFLAEDLARYVLHRLSHRVPALWELHKVHHSAEVLTPATVYRTHPLEGLMMSTGSAAAIGVVAGVFMWLFPGAVRGWEVMGVYGLAFAWNLLGANLRHSHVWLSYGRRLEHLFISPAQHQVHHSVERRHHDRNFGSALAIWDWLFGTLYVTRGRERVRFGLGEAERNHGNSVLSALLLPMWAAVKSVLTAKAPQNARRQDSDFSSGVLRRLGGSP